MWRPTPARWRPGATATSRSPREAVIESRAFTEGEALAATPPLIDVVAPDLPDLLRQLDGRTRHAIRRHDASC